MEAPFEADSFMNEIIFSDKFHFREFRRRWGLFRTCMRNNLIMLREMLAPDL